MARYFRENNSRDYALYGLGTHTGRRISDLVKLDVRDVAYIDNKSRFLIAERLEILEQKTDKFISIVLHPSARHALSKYLRPRLKAAPSKGALLNEPLFWSRKPRKSDGQHRITKQYAWRILNRAAQACGLQYKIGTHSLRKTFGYMLYHSNTEIELIQKLLNHSNSNTTMTYVGITQDDIDEAILAIDAFTR
jgi:integrase